jgi:adenosylcobinamide kinase / adenosylcobinamide-phosphate guanylyltransferase
MSTSVHRLILIGGGARSGKSRFALARAKALGERRLLLATAQALDEEMAERIARHRQERGAAFETLEEPLEVPAALRAIAPGVEVVVLDCLTLWLSNLLVREEPIPAIEARIDALMAALSHRSFHALVVTNEVGMGVVPATPLGRRFRDLTGLAHQRLAGAADEVHVAILGSVLRIQPGPVEAQRW